MNTFTVEDINKALPTNKAASMTKWVRGRCVAVNTTHGKDVLFEFDTLEAYKTLRGLMLDASITNRQFNAYNSYRDVLKGFMK